MKHETSSVGILGGGISGLSVAYALQKKGISAQVYEQAREVGGVMRSVKKSNWLIEEGPNTLMIRSQAQWDLLDELGLDDNVQRGSDSARKRYVVKDDRPVALPLSIKDFLFSSLMSPGAKLRLLNEPFIAPTHLNDESVASFIRRRLGSQPLDYAVNPFVSGVYAGNPDELSVRHTFSNLWDMEQQYGSLALGLLKKNKDGQDGGQRALISFDDGCQALPKALEEALELPVKTDTSVQTIFKKDKKWIVKAVADGAQLEHHHDSLISTLPTHAFGNIFAKNETSQLTELPYAPVSVLALGFDDTQIEHPLDGFGMLIPAVENYHTLGVMFSSTLFEGCAPDGKQLLTCFIGGARDPRTAAKSRGELEKIVLEELSKLLGVKGNPVFRHHRYWPKAIPQYNVGFDRYLSLMDDLEANNPGLFLSGNFRGGVSVPDCISGGFGCAQKIASFLRGTA